jgi:LacI family transcriptional regulator
MEGKTPARRVVMAAEHAADNSHGSFRGVLDYKSQVEHWKLVGQVHSPVVAFEDVDFDSVDGIIGFFREERWVRVVEQAGVPAVNFSNAMAELPLPRVGHDDRAIGRLGAEHLLERGFTHFGFLGSFERWYVQSRMAGFVEAIDEHTGRFCRVLDTVQELPTSRTMIEQWLGELPKPCAVMAANDSTGCQTIEAATAIGLRVPDDVAVLGVDNDHWLTQFAVTPMSSVQPDWRRIGYRAAMLLDGLMAGESPVPPQWIAPVRVEARRSTDIVVADDPVVARALEFIRDRFADGITVDDVMEELHVSRRTLENRMKRTIGQTPYTAICRVRIEHAQRMLATTDQSMAEIARACGIEPNQFYPVFKRMTGMTPGQHRKRFADPRP